MPSLDYTEAELNADIEYLDNHKKMMDELWKEFDTKDKEEIAKLERQYAAEGFEWADQKWPDDGLPDHYESIYIDKE